MNFTEFFIMSFNFFNFDLLNFYISKDLVWAAVCFGLPVVIAFLERIYGRDSGRDDDEDEEKKKKEKKKLEKKSDEPKKVE